MTRKPMENTLLPGMSDKAGRKTKGWNACFSVFFICILIMSVFSACSKSSPKSRAEQKIATYLDRMEASAVDLQHELDKIDGMNRLNTVDRLREAIGFVDDAEKILKRANQDVDAYIEYVNANSQNLKHEALDHYIDVKNILNKSLKAKRQAMAEYFQALKEWLSYSVNNFDRLRAKDVSARQTYDALLMEVNRVLSRYNAANSQYHQFVNAFVKKRPELVKRFKSEYKTMKTELGWL